VLGADGTAVALGAIDSAGAAAEATVGTGGGVAVGGLREHATSAIAAQAAGRVFRM
jgi:hypothetical protein